jgi:hypothetical protein
VKTQTGMRAQPAPHCREFALPRSASKQRLARCAECVSSPHRTAPEWVSAQNRHVAPAADGEFAALRIGPLSVYPPVLLAPMVSQLRLCVSAARRC